MTKFNIFYSITIVLLVVLSSFISSFLKYNFIPQVVITSAIASVLYIKFYDFEPFFSNKKYPEKFLYYHIRFFPYCFAFMYIYFNYILDDLLNHLDIVIR